MKPSSQSERIYEKRQNIHIINDDTSLNYSSDIIFYYQFSQLFGFPGFPGVVFLTHHFALTLVWVIMGGWEILPVDVMIWGTQERLFNFIPTVIRRGGGISPCAFGVDFS